MGKICLWHPRHNYISYPREGLRLTTRVDRDGCLNNVLLSFVVLVAQYGNRWPSFVRVPAHWRDNNVFLPPSTLSFTKHSVRSEQAPSAVGHIDDTAPPLFFCFGFFLTQERTKNTTTRSKTNWELYTCSIYLITTMATAGHCAVRPLPLPGKSCD